MGEVGTDRDVVGQRTVDRRRREELHMRAEVVSACLGFGTCRIGLLRLDGDTLPDASWVDAVTDRGDASRCFVSENER